MDDCSTHAGFRAELHACCTPARDALFEAGDARAGHPAARPRWSRAPRPPTMAGMMTDNEWREEDTCV